MTGNKPLTVEQQQELITQAVKNGIEAYREAIEEKVGDYDKEEVTGILSRTTFEEMWNAYVYADTMVRDYVMDIIKGEPEEETEPEKQNAFEEDYRKELGIRNDYRKAKEKNDEAVIQLIREARLDCLEEIKSKGKIYAGIYLEYTMSRDSGNTDLDLNDTIWDRNIPDMVACMRENGIQRFTVSSDSTCMVETVWLFQQNGCRLDGMTEINSRHQDILTEDYKKIHAFLFSIR